MVDGGRGGGGGDENCGTFPLFIVLFVCGERTVNERCDWIFPGCEHVWCMWCGGMMGDDGLMVRSEEV